MKISELRLFVGSSLYAPVPVCRVRLEPDKSGGVVDNVVPPALLKRYLSLSPRIEKTIMAVCDNRLAEANVGHLIMGLVRQIASDIGWQVTRDRVQKDATGHYLDIVFSYDDKRLPTPVVRYAFSILQRLSRLSDDQLADFYTSLNREYSDNVERLSAFSLSLDTLYLAESARTGGIPCHIVDRDRIILGQGRYQQQMLRKFTSSTGLIAFRLATDKFQANRELARVGLPVPRQYAVSHQDELTEALKSIDFPLVVKPATTDMGVGISIGITDKSSLEEAFVKARTHASQVILESFIEGEEYRVLVVSNKVVAIAQRIPAHVTGDGQHTIEQLVQMLNDDPRRGIGKTTAMNLVAMDDEANQLIATAGYNPGDVMPAGEKLALRRASNLSRGGSSIDMTGQLHSDYEKAAILAARVVGLDVAGVDFITPDFTRSWKEVGGGICEINPSPGLRMHHTPGEGERRDVAIPILDSLFPENRLRRIPTAAITGSNGKTTTTRMTTHILRQSGMCVGLTCTDGVYVDDDIVRPGDLSGGAGVEQVMIDPRIDAAVLEIARGAILKWGTGIDQFDIAAVTNIVDEHLGEHGIDTREDMAAVKGLLVELATKMVVLNADDPVVAGLASRARAKQLCYLSRAKENSLVEAHIATGQIAIRQEEFEGESWVVIYDKEARLPLVKTGDIPATINGIAEYNIENAMFAAAIAFGFGHSMDHIADALKSFQSDHAMNPGRLNTIEGFSCKLIIDFCHNSDGYRTVLPVLSSIDANRRYLACSMPGNRRDQDYAEAMKVVANHFDEFHLYPPADRYLRGKSPEESVKVLANGLRSADVPFENIFEHESQQQAVGEMLSSDETGNLIFIAGLQHKEAWNQIQKLLQA